MKWHLQDTQEPKDDSDKEIPLEEEEEDSEEEGEEESEEE